MKKIKNLLFILAIALIGLIGINNVKAAENYRLWVNGEQFTSEKTTIDCEDGTATFNNSTKTLTLTDATITNGYSIPSEKDRDQSMDVVGIYYDSGIVFDEEYDPEEPKNLDDLTIVLNGTNEIDASVFAMLLEADVTIQGSGSLEINFSMDKEYNYYSAIIPSIEIWGELNINNTTISINVAESDSYEHGPTIISSSELNVNSSKITIEGFFGTAISNNGTNIKDSDITIEADEDADFENVVAIWASHGNMTIEGNSNIEIEAEYGLVARDYLYLDDTNETVTIKDGNYLLKGYYPIAGNVNVDNYDKKIIASWYTEGINADVVSKAKFIDNAEYYSYIRMGNIDTYQVTDGSKNQLLDTPKEAFEGEIIEIYAWTYIYDFLSVKIIKTADNTDVTEEVDYNKVYHNFVMPAYPVTVKASFKINYNVAPIKITTKLTKYNSVKVSWSIDEYDYAHGYYVYCKKASSTTWTKIANTTKTYYTKTGLTSGTKYNFKVVPYVIIYNTQEKPVYIPSIKYRSSSIYTLKKMAKPRLVLASSNKLSVKWTKINGASGYQVAQSSTKSGKYTVVKTTSSKATGVKVSYSGKKYWYKVRAYKTVNGKKIVSPWSDPTKKIS